MIRTFVSLKKRAMNHAQWTLNAYQKQVSDAMQENAPAQTLHLCTKTILFFCMLNLIYSCQKIIKDIGVSRLKHVFQRFNRTAQSVWSLILALRLLDSTALTHSVNVQTPHPS